MKKLVTLFTLAIAGAAMAQVTSQNVVGYNTVNLNKMYTIMAINFQGVGGTDISIQDAVPYTEGMTTGPDSSSADNVQVMDENGEYVTYYMSNGKDGRNTVADAVQKWVKTTGDVVATPDTLKPGTAFWYVKNGEASFDVVVAGQVLATDSTDTPINLAVMQIANPYAANLSLNPGIPYVEGMTMGPDSSAADNIQFMDENGEYVTYYMSNGKDGRNTVADAVQKWVKTTGDVVATPDVIPAGSGAWYLRKGNTDFVITIARPYSL